MFRFSHPARYAQAVRQFLEARVDGARELPRVVNG